MACLRAADVWGILYRELMPNISTQKLPEALRILRIFWLVLFATQLLFAFASWLILPNPSANLPDQVLLMGIGGCAIADVAICLFFFARKVRPPRAALRENPDDAAALMNWRSGTIVVMSLAEAVALFGFVLYVLGAAPAYRAPFIIAGLALAMLVFPTNPA